MGQKDCLEKTSSNKGISTLNGLAMNLEQAVLAYVYCSKDSTLDRIKTIMEKVN